MATDISVDDLCRNPAWHLYDLDMQRGELHFLEVTADTFRVSAFLDNRIAYTGERLHGFPIETVAAALRSQGMTPAHTGFLFHSSFCCSSLLARSLQAEGRTLVLREPWVLRRMGDLQRDLAARGQAWYPQGPQLLDMVLQLLGKTWVSDERLVIKPTHVANNLAADMLKLRPQANGLLLYSDLESFLISNLKKNDETKAKTGAMLKLFVSDTDYSRRVPEVALDSLDFLQSVAVIWHAQMLSFRELLTSEAGPRLRCLESAVLLKHPVEAVSAAAGLIGTPLTAGEAAEMVSGPAWNTHAKDPFSSYDSTRRDAENQGIARRHADPVRATLRWAETAFKQAPAELGRPLLP
jgi:hypothetical protein